METKNTTAFIAVDPQVDFCEGGALPVTGGNAVAAKIAAELNTHNIYDLLVVTKDSHKDPKGHFADQPDYVDTWPVHCVDGTPGAELNKALTEDVFDVIVKKGAYEAAYSGFEGFTDAGTDLNETLRAAGVTEVVIAGLATDHCVKATALDAVRLGYKTYLRVDLAAGVAPESTDAALAELVNAGVVLTEN